MAQKRIQYVKTATGVEKQLIASSADIVEIEKIDGLNASNVQDALEELSTIAAEGGVTSVNGKTGAVTLTKSDIDLGNVTNDAQVKRSEMGVAGGVATLDETGKVPSAQLPSYVDDVIEAYYIDSEFYPSESANPSRVIDGVAGKIYVDKYTNKTYRWSGTMYVEISASLALGETSSTAYAGDKGKANADNIATLQEDVAELQNYSVLKQPEFQIMGSAFTNVTINNNYGFIEVTGDSEAVYDRNAGHAVTLYDTTLRLPFIAGENVNFTVEDNRVKINSPLPNTGVTAGTYSAVSVDEKGRVTAGSQIIEWGTSGQTVPSNNLAVGGLFFALVE